MHNKNKNMQNHTAINETRTKNNYNLNPITSKPKPKMTKLIRQIHTNWKKEKNMHTHTHTQNEV